MTSGWCVQIMHDRGKRGIEEQADIFIHKTLESGWRRITKNKKYINVRKQFPQDFLRKKEEDNKE